MRRIETVCRECRNAFPAHYEGQRVCGPCRDAWDRPDHDWSPKAAARARENNLALVYLEEALAWAF